MRSCYTYGVGGLECIGEGTEDGLCDNCGGINIKYNYQVSTTNCYLSLYSRLSGHHLHNKPGCSQQIIARSDGEI